MLFLPNNAFSQRNLNSSLPSTAFCLNTCSSFLPLPSAFRFASKKVCAVKCPGSGNRSRLKITCQKPEFFLSRSSSLVCFEVRMYLLIPSLLKKRHKGGNRDRGNLNQCHWQKSTQNHSLTKIHFSVLIDYFGSFSSP